MRRRLWSAVVLGSLTASAALIAATAAATPDAQPSLITSANRRVTQDIAGPTPSGPVAEGAWLSQGSVPGKGSRWDDMVRVSMLDLHQLSMTNGAVAAASADRWNYAWPRDSAFVAVALARTGHHSEAAKALEFLQRVQLEDGGFEARYLLDGSGPPDGRARQSDGAGWALWALGEVGHAPGGLGSSAGLRSLLDNATRFALAVTDDGRRLPAASPDYWEVPVRRMSLGTVAPLLAGLHASERLYGALGEPALAKRSAAAAARLRINVRERFDNGYERFGHTWYGGGGGLDAAVTFLMPPFAASPSPRVVDAWMGYQSDALRPAGGLAPGAGWKQDGISWTPETALVAYTAAMSGRRERAEHWMD
ncbi:MAG: glycoside hydrolase family 15 protein, partial [Dermatophilaceae bacterium]